MACTTRNPERCTVLGRAEEVRWSEPPKTSLTRVQQGQYDAAEGAEVCRQSSEPVKPRSKPMAIKHSATANLDLGMMAEAVRE
jgi:hypothetical protein